MFPQKPILTLIRGLAAEKSVLDIRLDNMEDPIGFLLELLQRQADLFQLIKSHPKPSIFNMYSNHIEAFNQRHDMILSVISDLTDYTLGVIARNFSKTDVELFEDSIQAAANAVQRGVNFFDKLIDKYNLENQEPGLMKHYEGVFDFS